MNTSKYITAVIGNEKITVSEPITRVDYGLRLKIKGIALPNTYEVDFSQNEEGGESVTVIGDADGAEIPAFLIKTGKDIYAFLYWVGEGYGSRVKTVQIPNNAGPERTDVAPEPEEQSVIEQTIARLNSGAARAEEAAQLLENPQVEAETLDPGSKATASYSNGKFHFGIPKGADAARDLGSRVSSLTDTEIATGNVIEVAGLAAYYDDVAEYAAYGITGSGWYVFARIKAPAGVTVTDQTVIDGAAGYVAVSGEDHIDVAVKFEVAAMSQLVRVNWGDTEELFVFKDTDLAIRNLDYRVTFYVYDADQFATWHYKRSSDAVFVGTKYYTEETGVYTQAAVKAHEHVPADTYYTHAYILATDEVFQEGTVYYTLEAGVYTPAEVVPGDPLAPEGVDPAPVYYVDEWTLTTDLRFVGTRYYAEHDGTYEQIAVKAGEPCSYYTKVITYQLPGTAAFVGTAYWTPDESDLGDDSGEGRKPLQSSWTPDESDLGYARAAVLAGEPIPEGEYFTHAYTKLTAAGKFAEGVRYYKLEGTEYVLQEVTVGASYSKNIYYIDTWTPAEGEFVGTKYYLEINGNYVQVPVLGGESIPAAYYTKEIHYAITGDETFQVGKTYYIISDGEFVEAEVTVGGEVTADTYYEQLITYRKESGTFVEGVTYYTAPAGVYTETEVVPGETIPEAEFCVQLISWPQTTDERVMSGETYYTCIGGVYEEAYLATGARIPENLDHEKVVVEGLVRNVTYRLDEIVDCPMEFILPEIEDDTHGAWFEIRCRHAGSYSITLLPPEGVKIATEHTQKEKEGVNMINLHYTVVDGVRIWRFMNTCSTIPA